MRLSIRGGRSNIFRLRLHFCYKIFETESGSGNFQISESDSCCGGMEMVPYVKKWSPLDGAHK